jgi:hypothetical protein
LPDRKSLGKLYEKEVRFLGTGVNFLSFNFKKGEVE